MSSQDPIIHEVEQGTPDWYGLRAGRVTASMFSAIRKRLKSGPQKGDYTQEAKTYAFQLALERVSGEPQDEGFETWQMRRGRELEPEARMRHALRTGKKIRHAGFVETPDHRFGASLDGLIGDDGAAEYKCFTSPASLRKVLHEMDPSEQRDQVQGGLAITGRAWAHLCFYTPGLAGHSSADLVIYEAERDEDYIEELWTDLFAFDRLVEEYREHLVSFPSTPIRL